MNQSKSDSLLLYFLRLGAFLCFAGWTWEHLYWEGPYGILLWQDTTYALAGKFGISWEEFVGSGAGDGLVQTGIARIGWLYLACAIVAVTVRKRARFQMAVLVGGSGLLALLAYAKFVASQRQPPMLIEHGGQILMPVLLVMALALGARHRVTVVTALIAFVMTFVGHGSYALGLWPTPANYYAMTSVLLQVDHTAAKAILHIVGLVDFVACIAIFIPISPLRRSAALYGAIWGFLTAIARPAAGMSLSLHYWGADHFLHEAVLRAPHFLIPLYLFFLWRQPRPVEILSTSSVTEPTSASHLPDPA